MDPPGKFGPPGFGAPNLVANCWGFGPGLEKTGLGAKTREVGLPGHREKGLEITPGLCRAREAPRVGSSPERFFAPRRNFSPGDPPCFVPQRGVPKTGACRGPF